ncbi:hypothetical protein Golax_025558 [Gossypium laxum]|uniref:Uncharacterized protein n=1 Tax=Gossypium laxum TaxID=34288 RepID=A0A7J9AYT8_9ROSI|nr:hypothetical protein [Gossypium laxum]
MKKTLHLKMKIEKFLNQWILNQQIHIEKGK